MALLPTSSPSGGEAVSFPQLQELYDRHRYLDAYAATEQYWKSPPDVDRLSLDELLLAVRLAARLGGPRVARWLLRQAAAKDPTDLRVCIYTEDVWLRGRRRLDNLRSLEQPPRTGSDDPRLQVEWHAGRAWILARLRDFQSAHACLDRARALSVDHAWTDVTESAVLGFEDRWAEALASAERAWNIDPGLPIAAMAIGTCLLNLGRVEESAARAFDAACASQSFELAHNACWHQCALAETLEGRRREQAIDRARGLADRLPDLAPLADRESRMLMARARLDMAVLSNDDVEIERWVDEVRSPFHRQLAANLRRNGTGRRIRLTHQRTVQKHGACLPASLSVALSAVGCTIAADDIAGEVTFGGTPEWAAATWLQQRGFHVRSFSVTAELASRLVQEAFAFVLLWDGEEGGHAVAVVGLDESAGTLLVHDPQAFRTTEYLLTGLDQTFGPLGIRAMAAVPQQRSTALDALLPPDAPVIEAALEYERVLAANGPSAAAPVVESVAERFPSHPGVRYLQAARLLSTGQSGPALQAFLDLLREYPDAPAVRVRTLWACRAVGNLALLRRVLADIVERGVLPGFSAAQEWVRPPDRYVFEYADVLRLSAETHDRAETLLHALIRRQPTSAGAWHVLADLLSQRRDADGALLCLRLASCLSDSDEHYAQAYAAALAEHQRHEEGLEWLEYRARRLGAPRHAVGTWLSWIGALESLGQPERAIAACREALDRHGDSPTLLAFAVAFFARMGHWEAAEAHLKALTYGERSTALHEASARFSQMRGDVRSAVGHFEAWVREQPNSMDARRGLLQSIAALEGPAGAVKRAALWLQTHRHHEDLEAAYCEQLDQAGAPPRKKRALLVRRLRRNREDAWAWRELTFEYLRAYQAAGGRRRRRLEPRIEACLNECGRTSAEDASTLGARALWSERRGAWADAVARSIPCIVRDPGNVFGYFVALRSSARMGDAERQRVWETIRPLLLNTPGRLSVARLLIAPLAERFGGAWVEREVARWRDERPDDPDLLEAAVNLLIDHGHGVSDARRALDLLQPAVERYPYHAGLRFSLANAYRRAGEAAESEKVLHEIVRRHPDNWAARVAIAWISHAAGDQAAVRQSLELALAAEPCNTHVWAARARILIAQGLQKDAQTCIEEGLARMPDRVDWRREAVSMLVECRAHDAAVAAARAGVAIRPHDAQAWLLLGQTLVSMRRYEAPGEAETCLRRSLVLDAGLYHSADLLACKLTDQQRYDEAAAVLRQIEPNMPDPSPARGRLAWILRRQGRSDEAIRLLEAEVSAAPWYAWGWHMLMEWLEEDKAWEPARQILRHVPEQMAADVMFRQHRLVLLGKAGAERTRLDAEWARLQQDFPDDASLRAAKEAYDVFAEPSEPAAAMGSSTFQDIPWWAWLATVMLLTQLARQCP